MTGMIRCFGSPQPPVGSQPRRIDEDRDQHVPDDVVGDRHAQRRAERHEVVDQAVLPERRDGAEEHPEPEGDRDRDAADDERDRPRPQDHLRDGLGRALVGDPEVTLEHRRDPLQVLLVHGPVQAVLGGDVVQGGLRQRLLERERAARHRVHQGEHDHRDGGDRQQQRPRATQDVDQHIGTVGCSLRRPASCSVRERGRLGPTRRRNSHRTAPGAHLPPPVQSHADPGAVSPHGFSPETDPQAWRHDPELSPLTVVLRCLTGHGAPTAPHFPGWAGTAPPAHPPTPSAGAAIVSPPRPVPQGAPPRR